MPPNAIVILYLGIILVIFLILGLIGILNLRKLLSFTINELNKLKQEIEKLKNAQKQIVSKTISEQAAKEIFEPKPESLISKKELRKQKLQQAETKIIETLTVSENYLGLKVLDKLGVISILIGLVYLIGLGIEYQWINTIGRVFFGIVIAVILLLLGYVLMRRFAALSSVLYGGGFASLIFTVFAAFYQYELINVVVAYLLVGVIIGTAVLIAVITRRNEVAILTFVAGFLAPFTVNLEGKDYWVLFSYVIVLNIGVILFDYYRKSLFINVVSYAFTFLIYGFWMVEEFWFKPETDVPFYGAMIFLTIFYLMIFIVVIINNIRENRPFLPIEFGMLISTTITYYTAGYIIIKKVGVDYAGVFTMWIAVVNYIFFLVLYPKKNYDRRILNLFLAIAIMFFALVVPVEFMGKSPTLVWALQSILFMFIAVRSNLNGMKLTSLEFTVLTLGSLTFDWYESYISTISEIEKVKPIFNPTFIKSMIAVFSLFFNAFLLKFDKSEYFGLKFIKKRVYQALLLVAGFVSFYITVRLEIKYAIIQLFDSEAVIKAYLSVLNYLLLMLLALPWLFVGKKELGYGAILSFVLGYLLYLGDYAYSWADLRMEYLLSPYVGKGQYNVHYISAIMLLVISISGIKAVAKLFEDKGVLKYLLNMLFVGVFLIFLSNELDNIVVVKVYEPDILVHNVLQKVYRLHYSILWSLSALVFMVLGFLWQSQGLRFVGIGLYLVTLAKVFVYDIYKLGNEDLILLFVSLGVIMLLGSVVFQLLSGEREKGAVGL